MLPRKLIIFVRSAYPISNSRVKLRSIGFGVTRICNAVYEEMDFISIVINHGDMMPLRRHLQSGRQSPHDRLLPFQNQVRLAHHL